MFSKKLSNLTGKAFNSRFSAFFSILSLYILLSFLIRLVFFFWSSKDVDFNFVSGYDLGFSHEIISCGSSWFQPSRADLLREE